MPVVHLVDELPQRIQRFGARIGPHPLQRLHLVEHQQESGVAGVGEDGEQSAEEAEGEEMVEVALDAGAAFDRGRDVRLPAEPRDQAVGAVVVTVGEHPSIGADRHREHRRARRHVGEAPFEQVVDAGSLFRRVVFDGEQPRVEDRSQRGRRDRRGPQRFDAAPVHRFEFVQRRVDLVDLHLGDREAAFGGAVGEPAREERLAGAVVATHRLEHGAAAGDDGQFGVEFGFEAAQSDGELVESVGRHGAAAQRVEDLATSARGDRRGHEPSPNCSRSAASSSLTTPPSSSSTS